MNLSHIKSFEELAEYLREFQNADGDAAPYNFGEVVYLIGALLDNIETYSGGGAFNGLEDRFTPHQTHTLLRIAGYIGRPR